jgi:hypothetical protein
MQTPRAHHCSPANEFWRGFYSPPNPSAMKRKHDVLLAKPNNVRCSFQSVGSCEARRINVLA